MTRLYRGRLYRRRQQDAFFYGSLVEHGTDNLTKIEDVDVYVDGGNIFLYQRARTGRMTGVGRWFDTSAIKSI